MREGVSLYSPLYTNEHGHWITAFAPVRNSDGEAVAVLDVDYRADLFWEELRAIRRRIMGFSLAGALVALGAGLWYARRLARPLEGMVRQAREVAEGDRTRRLPVTGVRELAELAGSLNRMAAQLDAQLDALQRAHLERAHADRLASLGAVAAELAHEMNQPLTAIQGITQGILDQAGDLPVETRQYLQVVVEEARRLRELSQRLRTFSRRSRGELLPADLNEIVRGACLLVGPAARARGVEIRQELAANLPTVVVGRQALQQVVLNLLLNAVEAVDGRREPRVVVGTGRVRHPGTPGLEIRVTDNGPGIPAEVLPHIFEPFFSTKESSGGTGLGLSISSEIVERHGGRIQVDTQPDAGSCFRVTLPPPSALPEEPSLQRTSA